MEAVKGACIYFLFDGEECVYVGQTINLHNRIGQHIKTKKFDTFEYIPVMNTHKCKHHIESLMIEVCAPRYNWGESIGTKPKYNSKAEYMKAARTEYERCKINHPWMFSK